MNLQNDDDELDGCELDFSEESITDEEVEFLPLFPTGEPSSKWEGVFE